MPTFRVIFSGLLGFAFNDEVKTGTAAIDRALVVWPNLLAARALDDQPDPATGEIPTLDQHFPMISFPDAYYSGTSTRPRQLTYTDGAGTRRALWVPLFQHLAVAPDGTAMTGASLSADRTPPVDPDNPTKTELRSLWWLAGPEDGVPGSGTMSREAATDPLAVNGLVVARLPLLGGELYTYHHTADLCTIKGNGSFRQRVAMQMAWEVPFTSHVEISWGGLKLVLVNPAGGDIEIGMDNMEIDEVLNVAEAIWGPHRTQLDFRVYYDLSAKPPAMASPPYPELVDGVAAGIHYTCSNARFTLP